MNHVKTLSTLYLVFGVIGTIATLLLVIAAVASGQFAGESFFSANLFSASSLLVLIVGLALLSALLNIVVGVALPRYVAWARILAIVLGVFSLLSFPFGTLIGGYTLWVLLNKDIAKMFTNDGVL